MGRTPLLALVVVLGAMSACQSGDTPAKPSHRPSLPHPTATASPAPSAVETPPALSEGPRSGSASPTCVHGWTTPATGSERWTEALDLLHRGTGAKGPFVVVAMRYFEGPESPPSEDKGYLALVRRWYVKAYLRPDPSWRGRFLIEQRTFGSGLSAAAPFDSTGYRSPDWKGFEYDVDSPPKAYPGLPGTWAGIAYDFVKGGGGLTFPGLPAEVTGCMAGS